MDMAKEAGAMYASMPCCIRDGMYGLHGARHVSDDVRSVLSTTMILNDRNEMSLRSIRWPARPSCQIVQYSVLFGGLAIMSNCPTFCRDAPVREQRGQSLGFRSQPHSVLSFFPSPGNKCLHHPLSFISF